MQTNHKTERCKRPGLSQNSAKGSLFENQVREILDEAKKLSRGRLTYKTKPKLRLQNRESVVPDFSVRVNRPHEIRHFLIECQNRKRSTKGILHKIQHIRSKHRSKTFFFVYARQIGEEFARTLKIEGIESRNLEQFRDYIHDEALLTFQSWTIPSPCAARPMAIDQERMKLLSKTQVSLNSQSDAKLQLEELFREEHSIAADDDDAAERPRTSYG